MIKISYIKIKRLFSIILSLLLLIILLPILVMVGISIRVDSKGPILFKQSRRGLDGKPFKIYKFRSMVVDAENKGTGVYSYEDDPRVTKVGKFIRKTSLDELPQLLNILKGEMSIIGPRPVLLNHPWPIEEYTHEQIKRFDVRPGVTGLAQINGRKELPWEERIILDNKYIKTLSFKNDIKIFFKTIGKVLLMNDNYNVDETSN